MTATSSPGGPVTAGVGTDVGTEVLADVAGRREEIVALCADLVAAPSVNPPGDTRQVAGVVAAALGDRGIDTRTEHTDPLMPSVLAGLDSGRPGAHLILNVHLDTMPPGDEAAWSVPVWELTRRDGRLYGLGMGNMKGAVAAMVTAVDLLEQRRGDWPGRITFAAVSDEVVFGDNGAAFLLRTHPDLLGDGLICGEGPGFERLALGEKGVLWLRVTAVGDPGHSSSVRRGASATARLAEAVRRVDDLTGRRGALPADLTAMADLTGVPGDTGLELTVNVGTVAGGTFIGQVATGATAELDLRLPPGLPADDAEQLVRDTLGDIPGIAVARIKGWDANWTSPDSALATSWQRAARTVRGAPHDPAVRLPASDASRWRQRGVPALCFGPQPTFSAGIDDHAEEDEVLRCAALYTLTALDFLHGTAGS
ncbi:M20/M25/M40 family metallo-hydrolase [Nakamurella flavida]|uniref:M20/M25/M40 family metallo-hydrolase n=1 Tax=Nakamurella flavida TaxID=363630 RepID=A0A938YP02_9ACTN|nr:M20/M25/M40 family metallo-hydrolase [Nakamurella flavida]MBM9478061.1 M20/M25/M40 family metallo-hydrolase [Nakamurella flavida]MDP9778222.1 succinyl-diaminopimelate desuccinylase [Nakamurella flavida]